MFVQHTNMDKHYLTIVKGIPKSALHSMVMKDQIKRYLSYDNSKRKATVDCEKKTNCQTNYHIIQIYEYDLQHRLVHCYDFSEYTHEQLVKIIKKIKKKSSNLNFQGYFFTLMKIQLVGGKKH